MMTLEQPLIYDASAITAMPGFTSDDIHRRRDGEQVGYVPDLGDVVRFAMRHTRWPAGAGPLPDWPQRDAQGDWSVPHDVVHVGPMLDSQGRAEVPERTKYALKPAVGQGSLSIIDLDWWICERVAQDGMLW